MEKSATFLPRLGISKPIRFDLTVDQIKRDLVKLPEVVHKLKLQICNSSFETSPFPFEEPDCRQNIQMFFGESCAVLVGATHFWVARPRFIDIKEIHYPFRCFLRQTLRLAFLPLGGG